MRTPPPLPAHRRSVGRRTPAARAAGPTVVNDVHSRLNPTVVRGVALPRTVAAVRTVLRRAADAGHAVCVGGGRHAMGGQQFGAGAVLLDTRGLDGVLHLDRARGTVEVQAGIQWPALVAALRRAQAGDAGAWSIAQKQTGADRLTIGGAVAANAHGRGLAMRPFVGDVESLTVVGADGEVRRVSRADDAELFALVAGGYGLFGVVVAATLRLVPRRVLRRTVEVITADALMAGFAQRIADGALYGDFQFAIDPASDDFLHRGVFSTYAPVAVGTPIPRGQRTLSARDWQRMLYLAHARKGEAFEAYAAHYLATDGQLYASDTHQLTTYLDDYHPALDRALGAAHPGSEMITEIYVPRHRLLDFLAEARDDFRRERVDVVYGTIRLIERDDESFLAWAREPWACTIFNLHVEHTPTGVARSGDAFRRLIDMAVRRGGSYYLTYHRHATRAQLLACHPRFPAFLAHKRRHDPDDRLQSDWYRHHRTLLDGPRGAGAP